MKATTFILGISIGAALMVAGVGIAFAQAPGASNTPPPSAAPAAPTSRPIMLTEQDIQIIIAMSEECVKAKGFQCAEAALMIKRKLETPAPAAPPPAPPK